MIFFKYMMLGNLDGQISKLLVIVALAGMPEDAFHVGQVAGLSNTSEVGGSGFCNDCQKNEEATKRQISGSIVDFLFLRLKDQINIMKVVLGMVNYIINIH